MKNKTNLQEQFYKETGLVVEYSGNDYTLWLENKLSQPLPSVTGKREEITDAMIEEYYLSLWKVKPVGTVTNMGFVTGAKWMRDNLSPTHQQQMDAEEKKAILNAMCVGALNRSLDDLKKIGLNDKVCNKISENFNFLKPVILA